MNNTIKTISKDAANSIGKLSKEKEELRLKMITLKYNSSEYNECKNKRDELKKQIEDIMNKGLV